MEFYNLRGSKERIFDEMNNNFGLKTSSRIKTFVFKFISIAAKWIKASRQWKHSASLLQ